MSGPLPPASRLLLAPVLASPRRQATIHELRDAFLATGQSLPDFTAALKWVLDERVLVRTRDDRLELNPRSPITATLIDSEHPNPG